MSSTESNDMDAHTIILARWIVPVVPHAVVLERHAVVLNGKGRIVALVCNEDARALALQHTGAIVHDLSVDHVLIPGLINAHTHSAMTLLRSFVDNVSLHDWLQVCIWPVEHKHVSAEFVRDGMRLAIAEALRCGVTCLFDMYFYPDAAAAEVDHQGMRACIGAPVLQFPTVWASNTEEYLSKGVELVVKPYAGHERITVALAPHAPYTVTDDGWKQCMAVAQEHDLRIHTHLHETQHEVDTSVRESNGESVRPVQRLHELGVLGPKFMGAHCCVVSDADVATLAETGSHVVHCPSSNLKLASGLCPVRSLVTQGVNVAIGTDGAASNDDLDMLSELKVTAFISKLVAQSPVSLAAPDILRMATLNGAKAMGLEDDIGSLEVGKAGDITAVRMRHGCVFDPITSLVYVNSNVVTNVWIAGEHLLANEKLMRMDEAELTAIAERWRSILEPDRQEAVAKASIPDLLYS